MDHCGVQQRVKIRGYHLHYSMYFLLHMCDSLQMQTSSECANAALLIYVMDPERSYFYGPKCAIGETYRFSSRKDMLVILRRKPGYEILGKFKRLEGE